MDSEAKTIYDGLPEHPRTSASGLFDGCFNFGTKVFREIRNGEPYVSIYLAEGGWFGCRLADMAGDLAPFCD